MIMLRKVGFHKVAHRYPALTCADEIRWILQGLETKNMVLNNVSGQQLASY